MGLVAKDFAAVLQVVALGAALLCAAHVAHAQSPLEQRAQARELYSQGQQRFAQGDYAAAQHSFEQAYRIVPNPVVLLSIAECQVRSEQYVAAIETLQTYLHERPSAPDKNEVAAQIDALRVKPATLTVQSNVEGADIDIDAVRTGLLTPSDIELPPGDHEVAVKLEGYVAAEQSVTLEPGARDTIRLSLLPLPIEVAESAAAPATAPSLPPRRHAGKAVWIATGVAGLGLVTGIILGSVALKKKSEFDQTPTEKLADTGERMALFADVGFGVAAAGGVTAVILYLTSDRQKGYERNWSLKPTVSTRKAALVGRIRF